MRACAAARSSAMLLAIVLLAGRRRSPAREAMRSLEGRTPLRRVCRHPLARFCRAPTGLDASRHHLVPVRDLAADARAVTAGLGTQAARGLVPWRAPQHEVGCREAHIRAVEHRHLLLARGMQPAHVKAVHGCRKARGMGVERPRCNAASRHRTSHGGRRASWASALVEKGEPGIEQIVSVSLAGDSVTTSGSRGFATDRQRSVTGPQAQPRPC